MRKANKAELGNQILQFNMRSDTSGLKVAVVFYGYHDIHSTRSVEGVKIRSRSQGVVVAQDIKIWEFTNEGFGKENEFLRNVNNKKAL